MENSKSKRPSESSMKRDGNIWWTQINNKWVKCIPYNIKEEEVKIPQGDDDLNKDQFNKIMNRFDGLENKVDKNAKSISDLTTIVKKNHPNDFK